MIPKLMIRKQKGECVKWMTAKMNLRANKTGKVLIWTCPSHSSRFTAHIHQAHDEWEDPRFLVCRQSADQGYH